MTLSRQYIPAIGKSVKLKEWSDYSTRGIHVWSWMRVHSINSDGAVVQVLNGSEPTGEVLTVPLASINPPIGWQSQYTIYCKPEKVETVLSWFARGIVVRQSHDMSGSMPKAFQPMDNSAQPHWQFCEVTDAIPAEECSKVFRVIKVETEDVYDVYLVPQSDCAHCHGSGRRTLAELERIRNETVSEVKRKIAIPVDPYRANDSIHLNGYSEETETFECHCIRGGFRTLGRSKRAKLIKEWARDGWSTRYVPYAGGFWERTRETVVQDWQS
jgi:hypothetical protein